MEETYKPPSQERWTFRSLVVTPDEETGTSRAQNDIAGLIILMDLLMRCFASLAYSLGLPPIVVAPVVCCLFVAMIVLVIILVWAPGYT
jgi:hypothetical protein